MSHSPSSHILASLAPLGAMDLLVAVGLACPGGANEKQVVATSGTVMPIDDREYARLMDAQLHSEAKLKLGISVAGFGLGAIDYLLNSIMLDDTAAALFDFPVDTPIDRDQLHSRFHPNCARELATKIQTVLDPTGAGFLAAEHQIVRPDGTVLWIVARKQVEFSVDPSTGQRRAVSGLLAVRDITSRKLVEHDLRISEVRYRRLFEAAHDGVLLIDPLTSRIVDANPFMTWLLGYTHDQLVGKELFQIGLLKDSAMSQDMVRRLKTDLHVRYEDLPLESDTGQHRDVEVVANLYDEGGHAIIQCNIRDITTRKKGVLDGLSGCVQGC